MWQLVVLLWQFLNTDVASVNLWSVDIGVAFLKLLRLTRKIARNLVRLGSVS